MCLDKVVESITYIQETSRGRASYCRNLTSRSETFHVDWHVSETSDGDIWYLKNVELPSALSRKLTSSIRIVSSRFYIHAWVIHDKIEDEKLGRYCYAFSFGYGRLGWQHSDHANPNASRCHTIPPSQNEQQGLPRILARYGARTTSHD